MTIADPHTFIHTSSSPLKNNGIAYWNLVRNHNHNVDLIIHIGVRYVWTKLLYQRRSRWMWHRCIFIGTILHKMFRIPTAIETLLIMGFQRTISNKMIMITANIACTRIVGFRPVTRMWFNQRNIVNWASIVIIVKFRFTASNLNETGRECTHIAITILWSRNRVLPIIC